MQKLLSVRIGRLESLSRRGSCVGDCPPSSHRPLSNHLRKPFVSASATELFDGDFVDTYVQHMEKLKRRSGKSSDDDTGAAASVVWLLFGTASRNVNTVAGIVFTSYQNTFDRCVERTDIYICIVLGGDDDSAN
ncbi:hypothetical protein NECAME_09498 [Necator americanus]|uniref:Uncharacterized protein n=1 Tax=Necator americanus TaxID=51031 RepID=W2TFZ0_NECAM|nr:hypothetical protein NECAME_09498 [Necator americanus]ETN79927.1 hypothetical protein NECAME_09498 [Necator americanus]